MSGTRCWGREGEPARRGSAPSVPSGVRIGRVAIPTAISLAVHAALLSLIALATWTIVRPPAREAPSVELSLSGPSSPRPVAPKPPAPPTPADASSRPSVSDIVNSLTAESSEFPAPPAQGLPAVAPPAPKSGFQPSSLRIESGAAGPASFAGVTSRRAASVVFVVDCSGSMVSALSIVLEELARSIERLAPDQRFAIIPFRDEDAESELPTFPARLALVPATDQNLAAARVFLRSLSPGGRSDPLAGLRPALALRPEAIFFLARSIPRTTGTGIGTWGAGQDAILAELDRLNPMTPRRDGTLARATQISAIQFLQPDPTGIMPAIGAAHGRGDSGSSVLTLEALGRASLAAAPDARRIASDLDRATEILAELTRDGTDVTVLVGFPTPDQVMRVRRAASEVLELADRAAASFGLSEDGQSGADDPRIVLLTARASLLLAAADPTHEFRAALLSRAERVRMLLAGETLTQSPMRAMVASTWAISAALSEGVPAARAEIRDLVHDEPGLASSSLELTLGMLFLERGEGARAVALDWRSPPFVSASGTADPGAALLACDALARARRLPGAIDSHEPRAPYAAFLALPVDSPSALEREAIVRARLSDLATRSAAPAAQEPLERVVALLAGLEPESPALGELAGVLVESPDLATTLTLERAATLIDTGSADAGFLRHAASLADVARATARSDASRTHAATLGIVARTRLVNQHPSEPAIEDLVASIGGETAAPAAGGVDSDTLDAARLVAVAALIDSTRTPRWSDARALELLAGVSASGPARSAAGTLLAAVDARLDAISSAQPDADRWLVAMRSSVSAARALGLPARLQTLEAIARTLVDLRDADAVGACRELLAHPEIDTLPGGRTVAQLLLAQALIDTADDPGAMGILVPLAQAATEPTAGDEPAFWRTWTLTLECISRAGPERAAEVRAHITRLSLIDESLGGEPWAARLRALAP